MKIDTDLVRSNRGIFLAARRISDQAERRAFLDDACGEDVERRRTIEQLLAVGDSGVASPLDRAIEQLVPAENHTQPSATLGADADPSADFNFSSHPMIDRYKLLEQIGEGGMGTVFMAQQTEPIRRKVALKLIKPGMDSREVISRFQAERQALAMMDHPHIAHVLDAGTTAEGRPYFVMELVRGVPITDYCDHDSLSIDDRLRRFIDVCRAVQHAHQKGIIHRDLKPSNVMVTLHDGVPVVKVIDFGVAKALNQELTQRTLFTQFSQLIGTPLYMSPEQAEMSGLDVDTRSDIYSLGVLLYELLTGTTPFDKETLSKAGLDGMRRMIREQEPQRPSQRISTLEAHLASTVSSRRTSDPRHLALSMRRELDWIVMKALEKDRNRRYESASAMAADVQRYLDDEPVAACPPSAVYRLRTNAKRHKGLLTMAAFVLATLLAATTVSLSYAIQAEQARGEAVGAQKEAEKDKETALAAQRLADERFKQSQADFARALKSLDTIVDEVSSPQFAQLPGAGPIRDRIIEQALQHYQQIVEDHSEDPYARQQQAIAYAQIGKILQVTSKHEEARNANDQSLAILESLYAEDPENRGLQLDLIDVLFKRAHTTGYSSEEKLRSAERALAVMAKAIESGKLKRFRHFALLHQVAANLLPADSPRAKELVEEITRLAEAHDFPPPPGTHAWLARRALESEDYEKAEQLYRSCINTFKASRDSTDRWIPHNSQWWAAQYAFEFAKLLEQRDRPEDAEALYREALQLMTPLVQSYGQFPHYRREFKKSISSLVAIMVALNRHDQARADVKRVIDRGDGTYYTRYQAALLSLKLADMAGYRKQCQQMLEACADSDDPTETHFSAWTCALAANALDDYAPAIERARRAAEKEADNQQYRGGLGAILMRAGRYDESKAELERALQAADTEQTSRSYVRYFLSLVEHHRGDEKAAAEHLKAANEGSERELADAPAWNRELTLQLLRDEVSRLIGHRAGLP